MDKTHIFHVIPSFSHGGGPIGIACIMNHFAHEASYSLFSTNGGYECKSRIKENVDLNIAEIKDHEKGNLFQRVQRYIEILKKMKPDVLLTYNWGSIEWALAASFIPKLTHYHLEHGFGPEEANKTLLRRDLFRRLALRNVNGIIVPSQNLKKIARKAWHFPDSKINYIANGVDCDRFSPKAKKSKIKGFVKAKDEVIIGTLTPLRPEKNLTRLIKAFHKLRIKLPNKKIQLLIMGEGRQRAILESLIIELNLDDFVILSGHVEKPEHTLGHLDIYCMSSDTEQMPIAIQEAMAAGLPIVGINVGDVKNIMPEESKKYITDAGDEEAYISAIASLCLDEEKRKKLSIINREHIVKFYNEQIMFKNYAPFWNVEYKAHSS